MGMAASQARFLGLTARKSNVEYQGQQVNQQRTALANDSANLYNQMMELDVPTPPSADNFYKTYYVLDGSSDGYATTDYRFQNADKTYDGENRYLVYLTTKKENVVRDNPKFQLGKTKANEDGTYTMSLKRLDATSSTPVKFDPDSQNPFKKEKVVGDDGVTKEKDVLSINKNQIYKADSRIEGYDTCFESNNDDVQYYFFQDDSGKNHFLSQKQLDDLLNGNEDDSAPETYEFATTRTYTTEVPIQVRGRMESSESGRYSTIEIDDDNDTYPEALKGKTFSISTVQEKDEKGYEEAYNDYQFRKDQYEHTIDEINAQTEVIQNEDKQLELRLRELETEQKAISTEMDSVKKVIEDNVDKTFNIFG